MSKFDGLGGTPVKTNKFEGLGGVSVQQQQQNHITPKQEDEGYLATIGKSIVTGAFRFLDIPQVVGTLAEKGSKLYAKQSAKNTELNPNIRGKFQKYADSPEVISSIKPVSQWVRDSIAGEGNLDARPVSAGQRIISDVADFGTSFVTNPLGLLGVGGKAVTGLDRLRNAGGALKTGAAIGATAGTLKEVGVDPLIADVGASLAVPLGGSALNRVSGLSPNKINKQVYEAAKDLNIELPAAAVSRSKALDLADQFVGKTPIAGDILAKKYNVVGTRISEELEKVYDKIIPKAELAGVEDRIAKLYHKAETNIPLEGGVQPINLTNKITDIEDKLAKGYFSSKKGKEVSEILDKLKQNETTLKTLEKKASKLYDIGPKDGSVKPKNLSKSIKETESKIGKGYFTSDEQKDVLNILDKIKTNMAEEIKSAPIKKLIATKKALNNQITWDKSEGYKNLLKGIQRSINEDIKAYSKTSVEAGDWYKFYTEADELFGQVKTRESLERILTGKATDFATETIKHGNLSKIIHDPKTRDEIKRLIGKTGTEAEKTLDKIDKIGEVTKAITIKNRNVPNPSGTANVAAITGFVGGMFYSPIGAVSTVGATTILTYMVTNQKFLDTAYNALVLKDKSALIRFGKQIETITGASVIDLSRQLDRAQDKPVLSSEERKRKHLRTDERKKAAEKAKIDMDKWIEEDRKNSLIDLFDFSPPSTQNKIK